MSLTKVLKKILSVTVIFAFMMQQTGFVFAAVPVDDWSDLKDNVEDYEGEYNVTVPLTADESLAPGDDSGTILVTGNNRVITGEKLTHNGQHDPLFRINDSGVQVYIGNDLDGTVYNEGTVVYGGSDLRGLISGGPNATFRFDATTASNGGVVSRNIELSSNAQVTVTNEGNLRGWFLNNAGRLTNEGEIRIEADSSVPGSGVITNSGTLDNNSALYGAITNTGTLTSSATNLNGAVTNNNALTLEGGETQAAIDGTGATTVTADLTSGHAITQGSVTVNDGVSFDNNAALTAAVTNAGTLTSSATNLKGAVTNNNALTLEGGETQAAIDGTGATTVTADLTSNYAITQDGGVTVNSGVSFNNNAALTAAVANEGTLTSTATNLKGAVDNDGTLNLAGGETQAAITGTGDTTITADLIGNHAISQSSVLVTNNATFTNNLTLAAATTVDAGSTLVTDPDNLGDDVDNDGTVKLNADGTLTKNITGDGLTSVDANIEVDDAASIVQDTIKVGSGYSLTADADNLTTTTEILNDGTLNLSEGTNANTINGNGSTIFTGDITNDGSITQTSILNKAGGTLTNNGFLLAAITNQENATIDTDPDHLGGSVDNDGKLKFTDKGTLSAIITGDGTTSINSDLTNSGSITQDTIEVDGGAVVTTNASDFNATDSINNESVIIYTGGTNTSDVSGDGRVDVTGYVTNNGSIEQATVTNSGVFTNDGDVTADNFKNTNEVTGTGNLIAGTGISSNTGTIEQDTLTNNGTFDNSGHIVLSDALTNDGTFTTNADLIAAAGGVANEGDFNITGGTNASEITGAGTTNFTGNATNGANITQATVTNSANLTNLAVITADVANSGTLTSDGTKIVGDIANTGTYIVTGGDNANDIAGNGTTTFQGATINTGSITQDTVNIANSGQLTTSSDNIYAAINNAGDLTWNAGTSNANTIAGTGALTITGGDIANAASISQKDISITGGTLTSNADLLASANGITNNVASGLTLTGGTNTNAIGGTGSMTIGGDVSNQSTIEQATITVNGGKLTTAADALTTTGGITLTSNTDAISFTSGDNLNVISGAGMVYIDGTVQNMADIESEITVNTGAHYGTATDVLAKLDNRGTTDLVDADIVKDGSHNGKISGTGTLNILGDTEVQDGASIEQSLVNIASNGSLTTNSQSVTAAVANEGDLIWNSGEANGNVITGTGSLTINNSGKTITNSASISQDNITITNGTLKTNADLLTSANGISNEDGLTFTGGTNTNAISGTNGVVTIDGEVINKGLIDQDGVTVNATADFTNDGAHILADVTNSGVFTNNAGLITGDVTNNAGADFVTDGTGVDGDIANAGDYYITDGDNDNKITGTGNLYIQGSTTNTEVVIQEKMTIANGATFVATDMDDVTLNAAIDNAGTLEMQSGTNSNKIQGTTGTLNVTGAVTHAAGKTINQDTINIATLGEFTIEDIDDVTTVDGIASTGKLILKGTGTNNNNISGTGNIQVDAAGVITNQGTIEQTTLDNDGKFTSDADLLAFANGIDNSNELNLTGGTNENVITNTTGTTNFTNNVVNNAAIEQLAVTNAAGTLTNNAAITATTFTNDTGTVNNEAVISAAITNTNGTINSTADNLAGAVTNNGTLNVAGGTVQDVITGTGDMYINGDLVNDQAITQDSITNSADFTNEGAINATLVTNSGVIDNSATITATNKIDNSGTINSSSDHLVAAIANDGELNLSGGTSTHGNITGDGDTYITGDLTVNNTINQATVTNSANLTVADGKTITTTGDIDNSGTITGKASDLVAGGAIDNSGSLIFNAASTGASKINGTGDVQVTADTTLTAENGYEGGTLIANGATLTVAGQDNIGTGDVKFSGNGSTLLVSTSGTLTSNLLGNTASDNVKVINGGALSLEGTIDNAADFRKAGAGTMTFAMASNTYTGNTYVDVGKLIGNTGNINNVVHGAAGTTVEFNDTEDADLNEISTLGTFVQSGSAKLNVQNNAFSANVVDVNAGTFAANRALTATTMNIHNGAKLQGNGNITGTVNVESGATIAPGNSIDTLTITGDLNLAGGSTTAIEINETPASDKLVVTGNTNIASGANLTVSNENGRYFEWERFDIIESGAVSGEFNYDGTITDYDASRIDVEVDYSDPTKVALVAKRKATDYEHGSVPAAANLSRNQKEAATAMDRVSTGFGGDITNALLQLEALGGLNPEEVTVIDPNATLKSALDNIHGVLYANGALTSLFNAKTAHVYDRIAKRNPSAGSCPTCHDNVWVEYYNQYDKVFADDNSPRFTNNMSGMLVGYDRSSDDLLLGVYTGFGKNDLRQNRGSLDIEDTTLGVYGGWRPGDWVFKGTLSGGYQSYEGDRSIAFMGRTAHAHYKGWNLALDLEGAYNWAVTDWVNIKPFVGWLNSYAYQQSFTETGADALNLHVERKNQFNSQARLGVKFDGKIQNKLSWYTSVAVKQFIGNDYAKLHMSLGLPGTRMDIISAELGRTYFSGQVGLNYALNNNWSLFGNVDLGLNNKSTNCYGNVGVAYTW